MAESSDGCWDGCSNLGLALFCATSAAGSAWEGTKDYDGAVRFLASAGAFLVTMVLMMLFPVIVILLITTGLGLLAAGITGMVLLINKGAYVWLTVVGVASFVLGVCCVGAAATAVKRRQEQAVLQDFASRHPELFGRTVEQALPDPGPWARNGLAGLVMGLVMGITGLVLWLR